MGKRLSLDLFFNRKIDNFLELENLKDIVIAAI